MDRAVSAWLAETGLPADDPSITKRLNKSYTIYGCMLLLPATAFEGPGWEALGPHLNDDTYKSLYVQICEHLKVTHIALNKPIPLNNSTEIGDENILRSPTNFTPLHGKFGPTTCNQPPSQSDFEAAFWVTAKQNGIYQIWAPRWTMFSRGNISEKARLLTLPSVLQAVEHGRESERGCAAVDLYAGIGYFAFSYVKAGISKVLCWDLNPWSCEGLRRGARKNKWTTETFEGDEETLLESEAEFLVFNETNELAPERIERMRSRLPTVRHVNCGMLPSSRASLGLAAKVLDPEMGGWVHVHENFLVEEIEKKAEETRKELEKILKELGREMEVELEYVNRLKNYAPGVMHCVLDIAVLPKNTET
ncbi:tRNA wybutosine-synthesizing protein 2 [Pseudocercospora fuligena]|uniref:tRNA wybutosine-synthesizing protein 2 n=1 Tax=Pseudocercospora fuligena TaxID=685502 RepID=A0A8H6RSN2_9PEZI|nr:tRNA wybutosine-synthesizing protein 2 [Pseudocercospora fuligena]